MSNDELLNFDPSDIEELPEIKVVPWHKVADKAISEYQRKKGFIDVGKANRYLMWARLDLAAYKKATEFCDRYKTDIGHVINAAIYVKLNSLVKANTDGFWNYFKYLIGRNEKYVPLYITETDMKKYLSWLAKKHGIEFN